MGGGGWLSYLLETIHYIKLYKIIIGYAEFTVDGTTVTVYPGVWKFFTNEDSANDYIEYLKEWIRAEFGNALV